ncbi:MAG TPA: hypothetical protein VM715_11275, partial [Candidatus Acidoferrum sp.]|nr:hypothetical protein [Candidatus Acidoferrum sp.]
SRSPITARKVLVMAVTDVSPEIVKPPVKRRMRADTYVLIVGLTAVALFGIARFVYEPSYQEKQQITRTALVSEHTKVCDQLGKSSGPERVNCLTALDALYTVHQQAILADSSEI